MEKYKNKKVLVLLFIIIFNLFCHLGFGIHNFSFAEEAKEANDLFVAEKAFEDGFYEISLGLLDKFIKDYPQSSLFAKVNLLTGKCLFFKGKYLKALGMFEQLLNSPDAVSIKDAVLYWIAEVHFKGKDYSQARLYYEKLIKGFPLSDYVVFARYSLAWSFFEEGNFSQAIKAFVELREKFPKHNLAEDADFKIALCFYNLKQYAEAKEKFGAYIKTYSLSKAIYEALYYKAECLYYLGEFDLALDCYLKVRDSALDPKLMDLAGVGLGWVYLKLKKYPQAEEAFNKVKAQDERIYAALMLGKAEVFKEKQDFESALKLYDELIKKYPQHESILSAYSGKADSLYALSRYDDAAGVYQAILSKTLSLTDKDSARVLTDKAYYNLAWSYLKTGDFTQAISAFQKVANTSGDSIVKISALCQMGDAYQDMGQYQQAIDTYDAILKNYPESLYSDYVQYRQSMCLLKMFRFDEALLGFKSMRANFPDSKLMDDSEYYIGVAYFQKQDFASAGEQLDKFTSSFLDSPLRPQALYLKAACSFNQAKFKEAEAGFIRVIKEYPQDEDLLVKCEFEIAQCLYQDKEKEPAIKKFKDILSRYPSSKMAPEIIFFLGEHYSENSEKDISARYFQRLINDYPDSDLVNDASYSLGWIYLSLDRYDDALSQFKAVYDNPAMQFNAQAVLAIGDVYLKKGDTEKALDQYKFVLANYKDFSKEAYLKLANAYNGLSNYKEAVEAYKSALAKADDEEAAEINFRIAENLEQAGKINEAVEAYLKNIYFYSQYQHWLLKSYLRLGRIFEDQGNWQEAKKIYTKVSIMDLDEAKFAKEKLQELEKY